MRDPEGGWTSCRPVTLLWLYAGVVRCRICGVVVDGLTGHEASLSPRPKCQFTRIDVWRARSRTGNQFVTCSPLCPHRYFYFPFGLDFPGESGLPGNSAFPGQFAAIAVSTSCAVNIDAIVELSEIMSP